MSIYVCFCALGFAVLWSAHRREDVNVNSQSAQRNVRGTQKNPGDKVQRRKGGVKKGRKEGRGRKMEHRTRECVKRKLGEEE